MTGEISTNQTPRFELRLGGEVLTQAEAKGLEHLFVEDHVDMVGVAQVTFGLEGLAWSGPDLGEELSVTLGGSDRRLFVGHVTGFRHAWQHGRETLTITAMDPLCKLSASRKTTVNEEATDSDVVARVLGEAKVQAGSVDATDKVHPYTIQRNETDLVFLKRLAARNGYVLLANDGKIDFVKAQLGGNAVEVAPKSLVLLDYGFTDSGVPKSVTVHGWDPAQKAAVVGTASEGHVDLIGGGANAVAKSGSLGQEEVHVTDVWVDSQAMAQTMAVAELNRLARTFLRGRAVVQGDGSLHAGVKVRFTGHRKGFNPEGYVVSSRHVIEPGRGFTTEIHFVGNTHPS